MANSNDRIQLKREELVGDSVELTDINPKSNTKSIDDTNSGTPLSETIDRIWNAINNELSRYVNSVNGRTGVVVLNSSDVGLGNVDDISFADIQEWVINRIRAELGMRRLELYDTYNEVRAILETNDEAYDGRPYFVKNVTAENVGVSLIGYYYWDRAHDRLVVNQKQINIIAYTDDSLIYNENLGTNKDFSDGGLGINIYKYEDALTVIHGLTKADSGLAIDKTKLAGKVYFYNSAYRTYDGAGAPEDSLIRMSEDENAGNVRLFFDKAGNESIPDIALNKRLNVDTFKLGDIVVCNFACLNWYREYDGTFETASLINGINPILVDKQPKIGLVTAVPVEGGSDYYDIRFYSLKPAVDFGLGYYLKETTHSAVSDNMLGVKPITGIQNEEEESTNTNISGVNILGHSMQYTNSGKDEVVDSEYTTVTPVGPTKTKYVNDVYGTAKGTSGGVAIIPDMSMNVIANDVYGKGDEGYLPNWPLKTAGTVNDNTDIDVPEKSISYLGVNLDKKMTLNDNTIVAYYDNGDFYTDETHSTAITEHDISKYYVDKPTRDVYRWLGSHYELSSSTSISDLYKVDSSAFNLSGLKITSPEDIIELNGSESYDFYHSGGLSVNTGKFVEIGSVYGLAPTPENYYDKGKVNVRIDTSKGLDETRDEDNNLTNKIGIKLAAPSGLEFNESGSLKLSEGLGMRFSAIKNDTSVLENPDYLIPNIADIDPILENERPVQWHNFYGGLRYIHSPNQSNIGVRINTWNASFGEPIKHGSEGLRITPENVLGVQPYSADDYRTPILIKHIEDYIEEHRNQFAILPMPTIIFDITEDDETISDPRQAILRAVPVMGNTVAQTKERVYVVRDRRANGHINRYVYVGLDNGSLTVNSYEPMFEFYDSTDDLIQHFSNITYELLATAPDDWTTNWKRYYHKSGDSYVKNNQSSMPVFESDTYYQLHRTDENGKEANNDKIYVCGRYGTIRLYTWQPKKTIYFPDVDSVPINGNVGPFDKANAVDASRTLIEYSINQSQLEEDPSKMLSSFNYEQKLRADLNCDGMVLASDASHMLRLYAYLSGDINKYQRITKDDNGVYDWKRRWNLSETDPDSNEVYLYYTKAKNSDNYYPLPDVFESRPDAITLNALLNDDEIETEFVSSQIPITVKGLYTRLPRTTMDMYRDWVTSTDYEHGMGIPGVSDPAVVDDFIQIPGSVITNFESGVDVNISTNRGLKLVDTDLDAYNIYNDSISLHVVDDTSGYDLSETSRYMRGGLRFGMNGTLAVRINDYSNYDPSLNTGADDLSYGTRGLNIDQNNVLGVFIGNGSSPITTDSAITEDNIGAAGLYYEPDLDNVLGVHIKPDSIDGLALDRYGYVVMTGFIRMNDLPSDWSTSYGNYYHLTPEAINYADLTPEQIWYKKMHRTVSDFTPYTSAATPFGGVYMRLFDRL